MNPSDYDVDFTRPFAPNDVCEFRDGTGDLAVVLSDCEPLGANDCLVTVAVYGNHRREGLMDVRGSDLRGPLGNGASSTTMQRLLAARGLCGWRSNPNVP